MGLGLDRLVMVRKGIDDIRLLRSSDRRVRAQLVDLAPYRPVSRQPPVVRDMSIAIDATADAEALGDRVRTLLGQQSRCIEELVVLSETAHGNVPPAAIARLGMRPEHKNLLLRLVIRHPERSLTSDEANAIRDRVYLDLHQGDRHELSPNRTR
jgi:phenylalanyl-tRNA synthetase alpha chain